MAENNQTLTLDRTTQVLCPLVSEEFICGVTRTTTCTTDPAKQAKCPKC